MRCRLRGAGGGRNTPRHLGVPIPRRGVTRSAMLWWPWRSFSGARVGCRCRREICARVRTLRRRLLAALERSGLQGPVHRPTQRSTGRRSPQPCRPVCNGVDHHVDHARQTVLSPSKGSRKNTSGHPTPLPRLPTSRADAVPTFGEARDPQVGSRDGSNCRNCTSLPGVPDSGTPSIGRPFATRAIGRPLLSGGADGPEGSLLLIPVLLLAFLAVRLQPQAAQPPLEPGRDRLLRAGRDVL